MKPRLPSRLLATLTLLTTQALTACLLTACLPHVARKNARIEPGVDLDLAVGGVLIGGTPPTRHLEGEPTELRPFAEVDLQFGARRANNLGYAIQLKVPLVFVLSSLDLYLELPSTSPWYYGVGAELGLQSGVYGVVTWMSPRRTYLTLTGRALAAPSYDNHWGLMLNPQLSAGWAGRLADLSLFASFGHVVGGAIDTNWSCDDCYASPRKNFLLFGTSVRF
ncbi:MAG: hypothetical protein IPG96_20780 [Proteobacteria bacterium]|nr:hypothetical protein [Pseudomonadota bacterium]